MDEEEKAEKAIEIGQRIIEEFIDKKVPEQIAYAALGDCFFKLHMAMHYSKEDLLEIIELLEWPK